MPEMNPSPEPTVSSASMRDVFQELLDRLGADAVREAVGVSREDFASPDGRITVARSLALWRLLEESAQDPMVAFQVGRIIRRDSMGVVAHLILACGTLREGLKLGCRYFRLVNEADRIGFVEEGELCRYTYACVDPRMYSRYALDRSLSAAIAWASFFTGRTVRPREVRLQYPQPSHAHRIAEFFDCPVHFRQEENAIVFPASILDLPGVNPNDYLKRILAERARRLHERLVARTSLGGMARTLIAESLANAEHDLDSIAQRLGYSRTTLYRKLKEEGASYQSLLDEVRRDLSLYYLRELRCSVEETATLLGYSEASAFHRAYRRWYGDAPGRRGEVDAVPPGDGDLARRESVAPE